MVVVIVVISDYGDCGNWCSVIGDCYMVVVVVTTTIITTFTTITEVGEAASAAGNRRPAAFKRQGRRGPGR